MAIVEVTIVPLGTGTPSVSQYVADCHKVLEQATDLKVQLTPTSTVIEGELDLILETIRKMHETPFERDAQRVMTMIRIDDRRDKEQTMAGKIKAVTDKLQLR